MNAGPGGRTIFDASNGKLVRIAQDKYLEATAVDSGICWVMERKYARDDPAAVELHHLLNFRVTRVHRHDKSPLYLLTAVARHQRRLPLALHRHRILGTQAGKLQD